MCTAASGPCLETCTENPPCQHDSARTCKEHLCHLVRGSWRAHLNHANELSSIKALHDNTGSFCLRVSHKNFGSRLRCTALSLVKHMVVFANRDPNIDPQVVHASFWGPPIYGKDLSATAGQLHLALGSTPGAWRRANVSTQYLGA